MLARWALGSTVGGDRSVRRNVEAEREEASHAGRSEIHSESCEQRGEACGGLLLGERSFEVGLRRRKPAVDHQPRLPRIAHALDATHAVRKPRVEDRQLVESCRNIEHEIRAFEAG